MWGAIIGDIVGSIYEFHNVKKKTFGPLFAENSHFTDDTTCTIAVADMLLENKDPSATMRAWGNRYPESGYGKSFRAWLADDQMGPYNSWGNGAAMRVSPVALLAKSRDEALALAEHVTAFTHNHPEGIKGALATVETIRFFQEGASPDTVKNFITKTYGYDLNRTLDAIRPDYKFFVSCQKSVPEAILSATEATDFEDALRNAISLGGDSDTLACIAGAIAEARFGIPAPYIEEAQRRLPEDMNNVMRRLYAKIEPRI